MLEDNHISIDIETLGTQPNSMVLAVGFAVFSENGVIESGQLNLDRNDQAGRHINPNTIYWWMQQSDEARASTFTDDCLPVLSALYQLRDVWVLHRVQWAWGLSAAFDLGILEDLHRDVKLSTPWNHRQAMCLRTLSKLRPNISRPVPGVAHSAESDAIAQANWAIEMLRSI